MAEEYIAIIISGVISLILGMLLGRYGLMRNMTALVDSKVQQINTKAQIELTREQTDLQAVKSLSDQISSLIDLLSKRLVHETETAIQNARLESERIAAQNNLTLAMRDATEEMRQNQRIAALNTETILSSYGRTIDRIESGFRSIADEFFLANSAFNRITSQMGLDMTSIREMFSKIRDDVAAQGIATKRGQQNLDDVLEIFVEIRNTIMQALGLNEDALIRYRNDLRPIETPPDLLIKSFEFKPVTTAAETPPSVSTNQAQTEINNAVLPAEEQNNESSSP